MTISGSRAGSGRGRSIARAATAIEGASLRSLPLVLPTRPAMLRNPFLNLLAEAPSWDLLATLADEATAGGDSSTRRRGAASIARHSTVATPATPPNRASQSRSTMTTPGADGATKSGSRATPWPAPHDPRRSDHAISTVAATVSSTSGVDGLDPSVTDATRNPLPLPDIGGRVSMSELAAAARAVSPAGPVSPSQQESATVAPRSPLVDPMTSPSAGILAPSPSAAVRDESSIWPSAVPSSFPTVDAPGALGELLDRWSTGQAVESKSEPASPFTPATGSDHSPWSPDVDDVQAEVSVERLQFALSELLRREVEQYGIAGGLA